MGVENSATFSGLIGELGTKGSLVTFSGVVIFSALATFSTSLL